MAHHSPLTNSTSSLSEYIGCFDKSEYIYLGERYGYDLFSEDSGYNYITGGGSIVFNLKTVRKIVESCSCPSPSSPDDMIIASCLKQFEIEPIHSTLFHQARPKDYPPTVLNKNSISFHKFWQIDPIVEYAQRFRRKDEEYFEINKHLMYKYFERECVSSAVKNNFNQNVNQNDISHVELWCWNVNNNRWNKTAK